VRGAQAAAARAAAGAARIQEVCTECESDLTVNPDAADRKNRPFVCQPCTLLARMSNTIHKLSQADEASFHTFCAYLQNWSSSVPQQIVERLDALRRPETTAQDSSTDTKTDTKMATCNTRQQANLDTTVTIEWVRQTLESHDELRAYAQYSEQLFLRLDGRWNEARVLTPQTVQELHAGYRAFLRAKSSTAHKSRNAHKDGKDNENDAQGEAKSAAQRPPQFDFSLGMQFDGFVGSLTKLDAWPRVPTNGHPDSMATKWWLDMWIALERYRVARQIQTQDAGARCVDESSSRALNESARNSDNVAHKQESDNELGLD